MTETHATQVWLMRGVFVGLCLLVMFLHLLPLQVEVQRFAPPDIIVALTFAWALRRPDYVPAPLIAAVLLLADMLFHRPPGLWSLLVLLAAEKLKSQDRRLRDMGFVTEWITVGVLLLMITVIYRVTLGLLIVAPGTLFLSIMQYGLTVLVYPLITAASAVVLGVRRAAPGEIDPLRRRM